jgi:hypothetical protein
MKSLISLVTVLLSACGTHNYSPINIRTVYKTGSLINITNTKDTICVGDTIGLEFMLPNPVKLDDSSQIIIKNITKTGIGYNFSKSNLISANQFGFTGDVVEKKRSALSGDGRFVFNPLLMPLLGTTIHYVPQDTGTYILTTVRFQYLYCEVEGSTDQVQINFNPNFNVPDIHSYMLDHYATTWKIDMEYGKANEATPYYCFYVRHK